MTTQANGRVERNHGTHQDRLVKKLRRKKIQSCVAANEYLEAEYLPEHNRRFARPAASPEDYHRPAPSRRELDEVLHLETERVIGNGWVVRYQNRFLQVQRQARNYAPAKAKVVVCEWEDGRLEIRYRGQKVKWEELSGRPVAPVPEVKPPIKRRQPAPPKSDHPWKQSYQGMHPRQPAREPLVEPILVRASVSARP